MSKFSNLTCILGGLLLAFQLSAQADILFTNKGDEIHGTLEKMTGDKIYFKVNTKTEIYNKKDVLKVLVLSEKKIAGEDKKSQIKDKELLSILNKIPAEKSYSDAGYLNCLYERTYVLNKDMSAKEITRIIKYIFKERGIDQANARLFYLADMQKGNILYARAINQNNISYVNDTSIQEGSEFYAYPKYDKLKSIKFSIPDVNIGSVIDYSYEIDTKKHNKDYPFFGRMYFRLTEPMQTGRLNVIVPSDMKNVDIFEFNMPHVKITNMGDKVKYSWELKNSKGYVYEDNMPPRSSIFPHVVFGQADSWKDIQSYFSKVLEQRLVFDDMIKNKTDELTKGLTSTEEKVETIYNWLVKEVKLIEVGMGDYNYIPQYPAEVLKMKSGNKLDKSFLFYAMLKVAGIDADFVYFANKYEELKPHLPSIRQFTETGVLVNLENKKLLVAPYYDTFKYTEIPSALQDACGVIMTRPYDEKTSIVRSPLLDMDKEYNISSVKMNLNEDGSIEVAEEGKFQGHSQASWRYFKDYTPEELGKSMEQIVHGIHPNALLESYKIDNVDNLSKDVIYNIKYNVKDYALTAGGKYLIFKLPNIKYSAYDVGKPKRDFPLFWAYKYKTVNEIEINLPKEYKIYYLPQNLTIKNIRMNYDKIYKYENDKIVFKDEWIRDNTFLPQSEYTEYKKEIEKIAKSSEDWIILERIAK